ncbi:hypothetical protein EC991_009581, partial [Linnemannia zychae]
HVPCVAHVLNLTHSLDAEDDNDGMVKGYIDVGSNGDDDEHDDPDSSSDADDTNGDDIE